MRNKQINIYRRQTLPKVSLENAHMSQTREFRDVPFEIAVDSRGQHYLRLGVGNGYYDYAHKDLTREEVGDLFLSIWSESIHSPIKGRVLEKDQFMFLA